mmetsp:Transcript_15125/g.36165  ORF Transcript_15125/g.36165 Transcript_15125/m.36165 type:complete len:263 (-) Transcript_15125:1434-2222(-)
MLVRLRAGSASPLASRCARCRRAARRRSPCRWQERHTSHSQPGTRHAQCRLKMDVSQTSHFCRVPSAISATGASCHDNSASSSSRKVSCLPSGCCGSRCDARRSASTISKKSLESFWNMYTIASRFRGWHKSAAIASRCAADSASSSSRSRPSSMACRFSRAIASLRTSLDPSASACIKHSSGHGRVPSPAYRSAAAACKAQTSAGTWLGCTSTEIMSTNCSVTGHHGCWCVLPVFGPLTRYDHSPASRSTLSSRSRVTSYS